ncbi:MAG: DUF1015 family protein [Clostridiales Family XIII bacterium]|jgi:uncharacterized protein (DUF1015 family)|nr:DUF1015 family protein [Clostridiales Family XIII bacterium]
MATVRPFRAARPQNALASRVVAPPYDVVNRRDAKVIAKRNPCSFLHVTRAEIDFSWAMDRYSDRVYQQSRENMKRFFDENMFFRQEKPAYYLYRQTLDGRTQTGVVACVSIDEYENGTIKRHEYTLVEKEEDRTRHFDVCDADTEPVFLTYRADALVNRITGQWMEKRQPEYDFLTADGVGHALWVVDDDAVIAALAGAFQSIPCLYIADGHHRSASAFKVGMKRRENNPAYSGEEEFNFFMAAIFPDSDLHILEYNRMLQNLNGLSEEEFLEEVGKRFFIEEKETPCRPDREHRFGMFLRDTWYMLEAKPESVPQADVIGALDVSILQDSLLGPVLGVEDPRTDDRIYFVGGIHGLPVLERRVRNGLAVAFVLYPVTVSKLLEVADQGLIMPPKSTWFEPKLGSGLFVHEF